VRRLDLDGNTRNKYITLITIDVHGREIVKEFMHRNPAIESDSFDW
jgi:hypothetical protein